MDTGAGEFLVLDSFHQPHSPQHGTCPACRHTFLDVKPISDSDNESSDGDFIPDDEDDEEDDFGYPDREDDWFDSADEWDDEVEMDVDDDGFDRHDEAEANPWLLDEASAVSVSDPDVVVSYTGVSYIVESTFLTMIICTYVNTYLIRRGRWFIHPRR